MSRLQGVPGRRIVLALVVAALALGLSRVAGLPGVAESEGVLGSGGEAVRILTGAPATLDPARIGDSASAAVTAQLFETLTAFDPSLMLQPALASRWTVSADGLEVRFELRRGSVFSDGTPITGDDVVRSWRRVLDPQAPSPLASLALDIAGARAYVTGQDPDPTHLGVRSEDAAVIVRLERPADLPSIVASPTFAIVPPGIDGGDGLRPGAAFVGSGAYRLVATNDESVSLAANDRYWAGRPAIGDVRLVTDLGGRSPVEAFAAGELDVAPISRYDASWIAFDAALGPALVETPSLALEYYGFDTTRPPFSDTRVRQAFAKAVDWARIVTLGSDGAATPASGMVPPGMPGRPGGLAVPAPDPVGARRLLAEAGFPGGRGFPEIAIVSGGSTYDAAVAAELEAVLGVTVRAESMESGAFFSRLESDPPAMWALGWIADYPSPNDFLGVLLGSASSTNYGGWSSSEFDAAVSRAIAARDASSATTAYREAETIVRRDAPAIPLGSSSGWTLVRPGLLGAGENGLGIVRMAGLAWGAR